MLAAPNSPLPSLRNQRRESQAMSPCRTQINHRTPQRFSGPPSAYRAPLLTPSPLKRQTAPCADPIDADDVFSSPMPSSYALRTPRESSTRVNPRILTLDDDDDDGLFLNPVSSLSRPLFPPTSSPMPLRTPIRRAPGLLTSPDRSLGPTKHLASPPPPSTSTVPTAGTKRKPTTSIVSTTPSRKRTLTPLSITGSSKADPNGGGNGESSSLGFDRLAPLPAPRFNLVRTPQTKAETDLHLRRQADSMTKLRIQDMPLSGSEESGYDSGPDVRPLPALGRSINGTKGKPRAKPPALQSPRVKMVKGSQSQARQEEVVEAVSPGGHVTKRRARSRPVSAELLESSSAVSTPFVDHTARIKSPTLLKTQPRSPSSTVIFPSLGSMARSRRTSGSSVSTSSDAGSPRPRHRMLNMTSIPRLRTETASTQRAPLARNSSSSATLFFGPSIPQPAEQTHRTLTMSTASRNSVDSTRMVVDPPARSNTAHRHSYAGSTMSNSGWEWGKTPTRHRTEEEDEAEFFLGGPPDSSFAFALKGDTPSPKKKQRLMTESVEMLPKKFNPRDSGVVLDESDDGGEVDEDEFGGRGLGLGLRVPVASTSVSTVNSDEGEALVTPGLGPGVESGWPGIVSLDDEDDEDGRLPTSRLGPHGSTTTTNDRSVDAFIMRTLTAGSKPPSKNPGDMRPPGTPVKRMKTTHLMERPWQSAVANKIGFPEFDEMMRNEKAGKPKPRKSLPAAFPLGLPGAGATTGRAERMRRDALNFGMPPPLLPASANVGMDLEGDDDEGSPTTVRKDGSKYDGLGLGRPSFNIPAFSGKDGKGKNSWLMRRTSSGAFSSGSETCTSGSATPTRLMPRDLPTLQTGGISPCSTLSSAITSSASTATNSPTVAAVARHLPVTNLFAQYRRNQSQNTTAQPSSTPTSATSPKKPSLFMPTHQRQSSSRSNFNFLNLRTRRSMAFGEEQTGRFERDFVEIDELGRGEFGKVLKARYKAGTQEVFAVKKAKRFEGAKHRLRLREEVDILKHLSQVAGTRGHGTQDQTRSQAHPSALGRHPNVLGYIDSWEEDETLFIQTELCELGNFNHFLWEYGKSFPRLDEARVWKIFAELASGLNFIHDADVIHLDLKPANIFVTGEGRFKIGDFGMASIWPRPAKTDLPGQSPTSGFEREGDKLYLAPEVLQGKYSKAADIFSLGMTMLETATNIVVPDQGEAWHRLRHEDFVQVDLDGLSSELVELIRSMMRCEPSLRIDAGLVCAHPVITGARRGMEKLRKELGNVFGASALVGARQGWLEEILGWKDRAMNVEENSAGEDSEPWEDDWEMDVGL